MFGLGLVARTYPTTGPWIGIFEIAGNILLLILAVMLPIWNLPDAIVSGAELVSPFTRVSLANFVLSGSALVVSFHRHQRAAMNPREARVGSPHGSP